jgi:hypothetical protein
MCITKNNDEVDRIYERFRRMRRRAKKKTKKVLDKRLRQA